MANLGVDGIDLSIEDVMARPNLTGRLQLRWHHDYWDGPMSGYAQLDFEDGYWLHCIDESNDRRRTRTYMVLKLTSEQDRIARTNHELFRKHVGTHTDYDEGSRGGAVQPRVEWDKFFKAEREKLPPYENSQVVGWTTSLWPKLQDALFERREDG